MAESFTVNKPVATKTPTVEVKNNLAAGVHTFTLVVVDEEGNQSSAAKARVTVRKEAGRDTDPVIVRPNG